MIQLVTVPVYVGITAPDILGTLSVGFMLDNALAAQLKQITLSDIAFGMNGQILAATLPDERYGALGGRCAPAASRGCCSATKSTKCCRARSTQGRRRAGRLRSSRLDPAIAHRAAAVAASITPGCSAPLVAVLLATVLSFAVARTMARPLAAITGGDARGRLHRRPDPQDRARTATWDDDDARLLATTLQHPDRFDRALPARHVAEGSADRRSAASPPSSRTKSATR